MKHTLRTARRFAAVHRPQGAQHSPIEKTRKHSGEGNDQMSAPRHHDLAPVIPVGAPDGLGGALGGDAAKVPRGKAQAVASPYAIPYEGGIDNTRTDRVEVDSVGRQFQARGPSNAVERMLGGAVAGHIRDADESRHTR